MGKSVQERLTEFAKYHAEGDGECNNVVLRAWADKKALSIQERYELAYFFSITYCVESAIVLFFSKKRIFSDASGCAEELKERIIFQSDRKYVKMRNSFEKCLRHFTESGFNDVGKFLLAASDGKKIVLSKAIPLVEGWPMFGRFSAFLFLETFVCLTDYPIENTTIVWTEGNTATSGLLNVFGYDVAANIFDKTGKLPSFFSQERMDVMLKMVMKASAEAGGDINVTKLETSLCAYRKFYKGSRYNGYYLDRMLEEIYAMQAAFPDVSKELLQLRGCNFPEKYLGEKHNWKGVRPAMKKVYKESGIIT